MTIKVIWVFIVLNFLIGPNAYNQNLCDTDYASLLLKSKDTSLLTQSSFSLDDDNCNLIYIEKVSNAYNRTGELHYLLMLERICNLSDGYVSEYLMEAMYSIHLSNNKRLEGKVMKDLECLKGVFEFIKLE